MPRTLAALNFDANVWKALGEHQNGAAMLREIASAVRYQEADGFEVAEALYYIAANYGGSEFCPLRRAENATRLNPGMGMLCRNEPEPGTLAAALYEGLVFMGRLDGK